MNWASRKAEKREKDSKRDRERGKDILVDRVRYERKENRLFSIVGLWVLKEAGEGIRESSSL